MKFFKQKKALNPNKMLDLDKNKAFLKPQKPNQ